MLETIITGKLIPSFVLIQDENTGRALNLFKAILKKNIEDSEIRKIHMICTKNPPEFYLDTFEKIKINTYDLFSDPCSWIDSNSFDCDTVFKKIFSCEELQSTVLIDSINPVILLKDINYVCNIIHKLRERFKRVICLAQADTISDASFLKSLFFFSNILVKVHSESSKNTLNSLDRWCLAAKGIYRKPSGKVVVIKELLRIDKNYVIKSEVCDDKMQESSKSSTTSNTKGLTTFRMGLDITESEKIARDNLILPYLRTANKKCGCEGEEREGKIVYDPESGDELEEDPDDDLDI